MEVYTKCYRSYGGNGKKYHIQAVDEVSSTSLCGKILDLDDYEDWEKLDPSDKCMTCDFLSQQPD